jgi:hypothetical protein
MGAIGRAGIVYPSGARGSIPGIRRVRVTQSLVFCVMF